MTAGRRFGHPGAMKRVLALAAGAMLIGVASAHALRVPTAPKCSVFPATNAWNARVDALPVAANSAQMIQSIGAGVGLHPDFGSGLYDGQPIGIPFDVVAEDAARVSFDYADESDKVRYPIPASVHIEGGRKSDGDRHALARSTRTPASSTSSSRCIRRRRLARRLRCGLEPALERAAARGVDVGRCGRPADLPGSRALRRGRARRDRPRAALHRATHAARLFYPARHYASSSTTPRYRRWVCASG